MTFARARMFIVLASLILAGFAVVFFLLAPYAGYPLKPFQTPRLLEIVIPVFLGYVGTATQFVFRHGHAADSQERIADGSPIGTVLVVGPVVLFVIAEAAVVLAFGISNGKTASPGSGMNIDQLATNMTMALGLMTVATNTAVSFLFPRTPADSQRSQSKLNPAEARGDQS
jgi:hypothetical protein